MKSLPPGFIFLLKLLPFALLPATAPLGLLKFAALQSGTTIPTWIYVLTAVLARPILFIFQHYYARYTEARAAAANHAIAAPHVEGKWPSFADIFTLMRVVKGLQTEYPGDYASEWARKYGTVYQVRMLSLNRTFTTEPEHIKQILATRFSVFEKGPIFRSQFGPFLGTGVFNSDGDMWKFHRSMTRPFFTRERIGHFEMFDSNAARAVQQAKTRLADGYAIDIQDMVARFTLDSATEFLFGRNVESLSVGLPYPASSQETNSAAFQNHPSNVFVNAFLEGQITTIDRIGQGPIWPLMEFWGDKMTPIRKVIDNFIEPLLDEALANKDLKKDIEADDDHGDTLLAHLVHHTQDTMVLKDELLNLLVAGRDTTACTLTFAFYMLAEYPNIAQRLRQEVLDKVGPTNMPTYESIREMKYLRAFLNEVLRLYPPVPFNSRTSNQGIVLDSKVPGSKRFYIPPNTRVAYSVFLMQRRTDLWGPDALVFDPDRFLDERLHQYLTPNPFIFTPFNAGPRICLGQQFAYQESSFFLIRLLQQFGNFRLAPDAQPEASKPPASWAECGGRKGQEKIVPGIHLTMYVKGGLWGRMDELKSEHA